MLSVIIEGLYSGAIKDEKKRSLGLTLASVPQFCILVELWGINTDYICDMLASCLRLVMMC